MSESAATPLIQRLFITILLALAVFATGTLSLQLILPEGVLSPFWPPTGIALAVLWSRGLGYWPGVLLGSIALSLVEAQVNGLAPNMIYAAGICVLATGASLQAVVGAWVVRRFVGYPDCFGTEKQVVRFFILAGLLTSMISPTIDTITLSLGGVVEDQNLLSLWMTGWIGDVLGVWIVAPITMLLIGRPESLWRARRISLGLPTIVVALGVLLLFKAAVGWEQDRQNTLFENNTRPAVLALHNRLHDYANLTHAMAGLFDASSFVSRAEFSQFAGRMGLRLDGLQAIEWVPLVTADKRREYEQQQWDAGISTFRIRELNAEGVLQAAGERAYYLPVSYVEPLAGNEAVMGFDLASSTERLQAMELAAQRGDIVATSRLRLMEGMSSQNASDFGFLLLIPVYEAISIGSPVDKRPVKGYVAGAFKVRDLIQAAMAGLPVRDINLSFFDRSAEGEAQELCHNCSSRSNAREAAGSSGLDQVLSRNYIFEFGGRRWELIFTANPSYVRTQRGWQTWIVLLAGLVFTGLFGALILILISRAEAIRAQVTEQTAELNRALRHLRKQEEQLLERNEELQQFAYVASHDLREPLRKLDSFSTLLVKKYSEVFDDTGRDYLRRMGSATERMNALIDGLLAYTRVSTQAQPFEKVALNEIIKAVLEDLEFQVAEAEGQVDVGELPTIEADPLQMRQLFQNLISNAIKYRDPERSPVVTIRQIPSEDPEHCRISVSDNGIGFDAKYASKIFAIFERLHGRMDYAGTGIGLAICRRIIDRHHGFISAKAEVDKGAIFTVELPLKMALLAESDTDS